MRIVKQNTSLKIENEEFQDDGRCQKHGALFPATLRCIIVGPSNCGKINVVINLIEHENELKIENVYIYSKSLKQPK